MNQNVERGAKIIINKWMKIRPWDKVLIVTSDNHMKESQILKQFAVKRCAFINMLIVETKGKHVGVFFDENETIFDNYTAIIAATDYSLVTTKAAKRAIQKHKKFLSLPLSTNNGLSMLGYDFLTMDTKKSKLMAKLIIKPLKHCSFIEVKTNLGTNLKMYKRGRKPGFFNGILKDGKGYSSASIEVYVPIEETKTNGTLVVDGSLGYIGKPTEPTKVTFLDGKIINIEQTPTGIRLQKYMEKYEDSGIFVGGEFGIGLNSFSKCKGNCYIEDESTYGTFHIGVGRNIGLGGCHEANGHFDLVCIEPDVYTDNRQIMSRGKIIISEPEIY